MNTTIDFEQFLENSKQVIQFGVAPLGASYKSHSDFAGFKVHSFVAYEKDGKQRLFRSSKRSLVNLVRFLVKKDVLKVDNVKFEDCLRCSGKGFIPNYGHVDGGVCFKCHGVGFECK